MTTYCPQTVIYEEKKTTYWIFMLILFFIGMMVFLVYLQTRASLGYFIILPLIGVSFGFFISYNIAFFSVKVFDDKTIKFGFPYWNKTLQSNEIISIEEIPYRPLREFGGLGWRIGRKRKKGKWRIGYVMWFQKGIEIESTNGKYYIFGTNNPESLISALQ